MPVASGGDTLANAESRRHEHWLTYTNDVIPDVPWSIHIVRIERPFPEFEFCTTLGNERAFAMATVSEQLKNLLPAEGQPLAAINGDFYDNSKNYQGRPRDLQIRNGEVVSSPAGHTCFWIDPAGNPRMTNVESRFRVIWPQGGSMRLGLNQERSAEGAVLYTSVAGRSTRTSSGTELVLARGDKGPWLPLQAGQLYTARVQSVRHDGDTAFDSQTMALSLGPALAATAPALQPGNFLQISTETVPDLSGVQTAIGGGPALVHHGRVMQWSGIIHVRHPRSAIGWNKNFIFLVEVDGRQTEVSLGMTFPELADYLVKLGCDEAMNFDGGGSATLWALGDVRNSPSEGRERPAANALVVLKKKKPKN
ncbi:MAG TPA: phosphodiester glycosidase family protein [Verrucomicrobiae bacterium]|nr:phosphodiester glycosidase family protein [Verrucomicrobiae bacterium]